MEGKIMQFVLIPAEEWEAIKQSQKDLKELLISIKESTLRTGVSNLPAFLTATEFMQAVRIKRTKFDQLVQASKIKVIKKLRKIYVPSGEVSRFFSDPGIR